jgi:hypothetical protein
LGNLGQRRGNSLGHLGRGIWALNKYILRREAWPKIQFGVELKVLGEADGKFIVEAVAVVENKGLVRHAVSDFTFNLRYLRKGDRVIDGTEESNGQVLFIRHIQARPWIPGSSDPRTNGIKVNQTAGPEIPQTTMKDYTFVDPGVVQRYTHVTQLPGETEYALLSSRFEYSDAASDYHSAPVCDQRGDE